MDRCGLRLLCLRRRKFDGVRMRGCKYVLWRFNCRGSDEREAVLMNMCVRLAQGLTWLGGREGGYIRIRDLGDETRCGTSGCSWHKPTMRLGGED